MTNRVVDEVIGLDDLIPRTYSVLKENDLRTPWIPVIQGQRYHPTIIGTRSIKLYSISIADGIQPDATFIEISGTKCHIDLDDPQNDPIIDQGIIFISFEYPECSELSNYQITIKRTK